MSPNEIIRAILDGDADTCLDGVIGAVNDRRKSMGRASFHTAKVGDKATLAKLKPGYLVGAPVTITGKNTSRLVVTIDPEWLELHPEARKYSGPVTCDPNMLAFA